MVTWHSKNDRSAIVIKQRAYTGLGIEILMNQDALHEAEKTTS
jgi:hypothetical protein